MPRSTGCARAACHEGRVAACHGGLHCAALSCCAQARVSIHGHPLGGARHASLKGHRLAHVPRVVVETTVSSFGVGRRPMEN